jgi:TRAP-type C4-dicarboxylate transport system permease small subunit
MMLLSDWSRVKRLLIGALALLLLTGCGSITTDSGSDTSAEIGYDRSEAKVALSEGSAIAVDQQMIQTASITLRVDDVAQSADDISQYVASIGGRIDSKNEYRNPDSSEITSTDLMVKVPSEQLDAALERLKSFGDLEGFSTSASDVTLQVIDLDARIASLESSIASLKKLLDEATTVTDLLAAETALSQRQSELDSLKSQRTYLADQIELSSIWISIYPKKALDAVKPIGFVAGLEKGWEAIVDFASNLTTWTGLALPWFGLLLVLAIVLRIFGAIAKSRRKR